jgi:hypothetical protein
MVTAPVSKSVMVFAAMVEDAPFEVLDPLPPPQPDKASSNKNINCVSLFFMYFV